MNRTLKRALIGIGAVLGVGLAATGVYAAALAHSADASLEKIHEVPLPAIVASTDPAVIARGRHLAEAVAGCIGSDCHGSDGSGGKVMKMGPLGTLSGPNITGGGVLAVYSDGEIARLIRSGVKKDGRSAVFMPAQDFCWLPDSDVTAVVSFLRSLPKADKPNGPMKVGFLGKVLDRLELIPLDVARRIESRPREEAPAPAPTADYGRFLLRICTGCHGEHLGGGKIPGAPPSLPVPPNLTPHPTGLAGYRFEEFERLLDQGTKRKGQPLDKFMPVESFRKMDQLERRALYEAIVALPARPLGDR